MTEGAVRFYIGGAWLKQTNISLYKQPTDKEIYSPVRSGKYTALAYQGTIWEMNSPGLSGNHQVNEQPFKIREVSSHV